MMEFSKTTRLVITPVTPIKIFIGMNVQAFPFQLIIAEIAVVVSVARIIYLSFSRKLDNTGYTLSSTTKIASFL